MAISDNLLTGELPSNIGDMTQLTYAVSLLVLPDGVARHSHGVVVVVCVQLVEPRRQHAQRLDTRVHEPHERVAVAVPLQQQLQRRVPFSGPSSSVRVRPCSVAVDAIASYPSRCRVSL
jgi:hypothetical protein